jgi:capsular exopolysaccharide synthesis family protein
MEQQTSIKNIDFKYMIHHYLHLFWRWKWYIFLAAPLSAVLAIKAVSFLGLTNKPPLTATVLIGVEKHPNLNTWNLEDLYLNKERLLLNRNFLEHVARSLSLQFNVSGYSRYDIFDSVVVDSNAPIGSFSMEIDNVNKEIYHISYSNNQMNIKNKVIKLGSISLLDTLNLSGIQLYFSKSFLLNPHSFNFSVCSMRSTIDNILSRLKVSSPNPREQNYFFSVLYEGSDYPLVTQTVNTLADMFVESNLSLKQRKIKETLAILEKQLDAAGDQLSKSKNELKQFLAHNPDVGLSVSTQLAINELIRLESGTMENNSLTELSSDLKSRLSNCAQEETERLIAEAIAFLQSHGNPSASSLQLSLNQHQEEKRNITGNYDRNHPIFKEIDNKLSNLKARTIQALDSFVYQLKKSKSDKYKSISRISSRLQGIPSKELQLAELQKKQEINSEIYSSLLIKFNEAKLSETVQRADVFIMDYAVQPIPPSSRSQQINALLMIILTMLVITLGPAIFFDLLDKTVRTEQELRRLVPYNFLVTLPKIKRLNTAEKSAKTNDKDKTPKGKKQTNQLLICDSQSFSPPFIIELFRSLNTKIQLDLYNETDKSIAITSLSLNEGKSTVAANLALSIAEHGIKTILIDCDIRKGVSHELFNLQKSPGLSDYLSSALDSNDSAFPNIPVQKTFNSNLWLVSCGKYVDNPQKYLSSTAMIALKKRMRLQPFFLVFDSPPIGLATDAALLSNLTSRYLLVVKAGHTNIINLCKIIQMDFPLIDKKILGVVLNMGETSNYYGYYKYYSTGNL